MDPGDTTAEEAEFKAAIVQLILDGEAEDALRKLSSRYKVTPPKLKVGTVKKHRKSLAVYQPAKKTIFASDRACLYDPRVVLHEFYHHLRSSDGRHKGSEKHADKFAQDFIACYRSLANSGATQ